MARGKGKKQKSKQPSLRDEIRAHRQQLRGDIAIAFDNKLFELTGSKELKKVLSGGHDLQTVFAAAKAAAEAEKKTHPIVDVPKLPEGEE